MTPDLIAYDMVKRGKLTESLEYLDDAIDKSIGDLLKLYENRAYVYINLGDNEKAIKDYNRALEIEPKSTYSLYNRALINFSAGKSNEALTDFTLISETNLLKDGYWTLGKDIFIKTKNYERALYFIERLCSFDKENYNYTYNKAWCLSKLMRYKESIQTYQSLIDKTYYQHIIFNNLGFLYVLDGQYDLAKSYLQKGLELMPGYAYLNSNISIVYFAKGDIDKAMQHIEISLTEGPSNPLAYYLRAKYLGATGKKEEAQKDIHMAEKFGLNEDLVVEKAILEKTLFIT